jgi:hypothetical protein
VIEVTSTTIAKDLRICVYGRDSGSSAMRIDLATVTGSTPYSSFTLNETTYSRSGGHDGRDHDLEHRRRRHGQLSECRELGERVQRGALSQALDEPVRAGRLNHHER